MKKNYCILIFMIKPLWKSKLFIIMRTTFIIMIMSIAHIFASNTYSQATRINLNFERSIVTCKINNRQIALNAESVSLVNQQSKSISGKVTDSSGMALPGVSIVVKGTVVGTITDTNGNFLLGNISADATLQFLFIGMKTQEVAVSGKSSINVILVDEAVGIEEVVAVGYGTQKKATITGSVATVGGEKLQVSPSINITNSLAGRLPGLVAVSRSGEPGNDGAILRIRGTNTLNNSSPLIVVDGIANRSLEGINSADIESINVLKDASAAIYGAQAANGVILVTTKRGSQGKPSISVTFNQGISMPTVLPTMADAPTYATMVNEVQLYRNRDAKYTADEIQKFRDGSDPWSYPNTNWVDKVYKDFSTQNNINVSLNGGTDRLKYLFSAAYKYQDGNQRNGATNYSQTNFRSNIDAKITDNIKLSIDFAGRQENRNYPGRGANLMSVVSAFPTSPAYWPNGLPGPDVERGDNPVVTVTDATGYRNNKRYILESNMKLDVIIPWVKGLSLTANASVDKSFSLTKQWQQPWILYSWNGQDYDTNHVPVLNGASKGVSDPNLTQTYGGLSNTTLNGLINYERTFGSHSIKILAGVEKNVGDSIGFYAFRRYFISTKAQELFAGSDLEKDNNGSSAANARLNYFGRVNYNYLQKYMAEFVWRYDGSYIFPAKSRFGFFPGISLGWRISEEDFWKKNFAFINYFKIRGSWGQTGNDRISRYQYVSSYGFGNPYFFNNSLESKTLKETRVPNPNITWEIANQSNIGFDTQLLGEKLTFSAEYFFNRRTDILTQRGGEIAATAGFTPPDENIGITENKGFEFEVGYKNKAGAFSYQVSINAAFQKNKIIYWAETPGVPDYQKSTGKPINSRLLYHAIGIFKDQAAIDAYPHMDNARPGDIIFEDVSKDGKIDALDMVRNDKTDLPTFTGGLNINLGYKNFYATILLQYAAGASMTHYTNGGLFGNYLEEDAAGRWTPDNINASKPRAWNFSEEYWTASYDINNTYFYRSTDYVRLKNLEIGYNVPATIYNKLGLQGLRVYLNGLNLLTFTKLKNFDPESASIGGFPPLKVYNMGISLTF